MSGTEGPGDAELERADVDVLADAWSRAWTEGAGFAACCTVGISYEDPRAIEPLTGLDPIERHAQALRTAFPDVHVEHTAPALQRGAHACIPWRLRGTHLGRLAGLPGTEEKIVIHGLHYVELTDGRISRARGFFDLYDGSIQLGLLPARGGLGESALLLLRGFGVRRGKT